MVFNGATPLIKDKDFFEQSDQCKKTANERDEPLDANEEGYVNSKRHVWEQPIMQELGIIIKWYIIIEVTKVLWWEADSISSSAPYKTDGQLAYFQSVKGIDVVATEDSDLIAHGCHSILYKNM